MDKSQIILLTAVVLFLGIRIYQKYLKKNSGKSEIDNKTSSGSNSLSSFKGDDYEPYSKG